MVIFFLFVISADGLQVMWNANPNLYLDLNPFFKGGILVAIRRKNLHTFSISGITRCHQAQHLQCIETNKYLRLGHAGMLIKAALRIKTDSSVNSRLKIVSMNGHLSIVSALWLTGNQLRVYSATACLSQCQLGLGHSLVLNSEQWNIFLVPLQATWHW